MELGPLSCPVPVGRSLFEVDKPWFLDGLGSGPGPGPSEQFLAQARGQLQAS